MPRDEIPDEVFFMRIFECFQIDHLKIAALRKVSFFVDDVCNTAAHPGGKISSRAAEDHDPTSGHVLAAVIAHAFNHSDRAAISHREPLAGDTSDKRFTGRRAIERDVADDDVIFGAEAGLPRRENHDSSTRESFCEIVVGVPFQGQAQPFRNEGAKTLAGRTRESDTNRIVGQTFAAKTARDLAAQQRADGSIRISNRKL